SVVHLEIDAAEKVDERRRMGMRAADIVRVVEGVGGVHAGHEDDVAAEDARLEDVPITPLALVEEEEGTAHEGERLAEERQPEPAGRQRRRLGHRFAGRLSPRRSARPSVSGWPRAT